MGLFAFFEGCISHCVTGDRRCHRHKQPDICLSCSGNWMKKKIMMMSMLMTMMSMLMRKGEWCVSGAYWQFHCLLDIHSYKGADWGQSTTPCYTLRQYTTIYISLRQSTTIYNTMLHCLFVIQLSTTPYNTERQYKTNYNILGPPLRNYVVL